MATLSTTKLPNAGIEQLAQPKQSPPPPPGHAPTNVPVMGGPGMPVQQQPTTPFPATAAQTATPFPTAAPPLAGQQPPAQVPAQAQPAQPLYNEADIVQNYLGQVLSTDSALMRDARTRGVEAAASRGLHNSSIAAGASQRAALDTAMPIVQQATNLFANREQRDWTATQNQLDRDQQITMAQVTNWLNNETFMRDFNAQLALFPIQNSTQLLNYISQQAINDPEVYTPDVVSGMSEYFTTNFLDVLSRYFPSLYQNRGGN